MFGQDLLLAFGAKQNDLIRGGELWRFITPIFLHGSFFHLGFNMFILLIFGISLERVFGQSGLVLLYFLGGYAGYVFSFLLSSSITIGASTAIFGLFGAEAVYLFRNRITDRRAHKFLAMAIFVVIATLLSTKLPTLDIWGHLGGLIGGLIFAWVAGSHWEAQGGSPNLQIVDRCEPRDVVVGAAVAIFIFSTLAVIGLWFPFA